MQTVASSFYAVLYTVDHIGTTDFLLEIFQAFCGMMRNCAFPGRHDTSCWKYNDVFKQSRERNVCTALKTDKVGPENRIERISGRNTFGHLVDTSYLKRVNCYSEQQKAR